MPRSNQNMRGRYGFYNVPNQNESPFDDDGSRLIQLADGTWNYIRQGRSISITRRLPNTTQTVVTNEGRRLILRGDIAPPPGFIVAPSQRTPGLDVVETGTDEFGGTLSNPRVRYGDRFVLRAGVMAPYVNPAYTMLAENEPNNSPFGVAVNFLNDQGNRVFAGDREVVFGSTVLEDAVVQLSAIVPENVQENTIFTGPESLMPLIEQYMRQSVSSIRRAFFALEAPMGIQVTVSVDGTGVRGDIGLFAFRADTLATTIWTVGPAVENAINQIRDSITSWSLVRPSAQNNPQIFIRSINITLIGDVQHLRGPQFFYPGSFNYNGGTFIPTPNGLQRKILNVKSNLYCLVCCLSYVLIPECRESHTDRESTYRKFDGPMQFHPMFQPLFDSIDVWPPRFDADLRDKIEDMFPTLSLNVWQTSAYRLPNDPDEKNPYPVACKFLPYLLQGRYTRDSSRQQFTFALLYEPQSATGEYLQQNNKVHVVLVLNPEASLRRVKNRTRSEICHSCHMAYTPICSNKKEEALLRKRLALTTDMSFTTTREQLIDKALKLWSIQHVCPSSLPSSRMLDCIEDEEKLKLLTNGGSQSANIFHIRSVTKSHLTICVYAPPPDVGQPVILKARIKLSKEFYDMADYNYPPADHPDYERYAIYVPILLELYAPGLSLVYSSFDEFYKHVDYLSTILTFIHNSIYLRNVAFLRMRVMYLQLHNCAICNHYVKHVNHDTIDKWDVYVRCSSSGMLSEDCLLCRHCALSVKHTRTSVVIYDYNLGHNTMRYLHAIRTSDVSLYMQTAYEAQMIKVANRIVIYGFENFFDVDIDEIVKNTMKADAERDEACAIMNVVMYMKNMLYRNFKMDMSHFQTISSLSEACFFLHTMASFKLPEDYRVTQIALKGFRGGILWSRNDYASVPALRAKDSGKALRWIEKFDIRSSYASHMAQPLPQGTFVYRGFDFSHYYLPGDVSQDCNEFCMEQLMSLIEGTDRLLYQDSLFEIEADILDCGKEFWDQFPPFRSSTVGKLQMHTEGPYIILGELLLYFLNLGNGFRVRTIKSITFWKGTTSKAADFVNFWQTFRKQNTSFVGTHCAKRIINSLYGRFAMHKQYPKHLLCSSKAAIKDLFTKSYGRVTLLSIPSTILDEDVHFDPSSSNKIFEIKLSALFMENFYKWRKETEVLNATAVDSCEFCDECDEMLKRYICIVILQAIGRDAFPFDIIMRRKGMYLFLWSIPATASSDDSDEEFIGILEQVFLYLSDDDQFGIKIQQADLFTKYILEEPVTDIKPLKRQQMVATVIAQRGELGLYKLFYDFSALLKEKFPQCRLEHLYTDTDSVALHINFQSHGPQNWYSVLKDISADNSHLFDFSNLDCQHSLYCADNRMVPGCWTLESKGLRCTEFRFFACKNVVFQYQKTDSNEQLQAWTLSGIPRTITEKLNMPLKPPVTADEINSYTKKAKVYDKSTGVYVEKKFLLPTYGNLEDL